MDERGYAVVTMYLAAEHLMFNYMLTHETKRFFFFFFFNGSHLPVSSQVSDARRLLGQMKEQGLAVGESSGGLTTRLFFGETKELRNSLSI